MEPPSISVPSDPLTLNCSMSSWLNVSLLAQLANVRYDPVSMLAGSAFSVMPSAGFCRAARRTRLLFGELPSTVTCCAPSSMRPAARTASWPGAERNVTFADTTTFDAS